ncbi:MAG: RNA polymerase sigma factor SigJ [Pseudomonadota bacterium]
MKVGNPHGRVFEANRSRLNGLAYRMLGSLSEAEDVVQDAYLRWRLVRLADVASPSAFLTTVVSRLCVDRQRRRKVEKAIYQGPWLPEPLGETAVDGLNDPAKQHEQREFLSMGFMVLLERLTPLERAVFVLREAFDFEHEQIAAVFNIKGAYSRQLLRRARQRLQVDDLDDLAADPTPVVEQFLAAAASGDMDRLKALLTEDVVAFTDGGGRATAALIPLVGRDRVLTVVLHLLGKEKNLTLAWRRVNGAPGLVSYEGSKVSSTHSFTVRDGRIHRIFSMRNPGKMSFIK